MPFADADGVQLHYESAGHGPPIIFVHEFAGDALSWEAQVRCFSRRHRCIAFNARGYPPSDVPSDASAYSQAIAAADILAILDDLGLESSYIVGLSMGAFAALHLTIEQPHRVSGVVLAGVGYGALVTDREQFQSEVEETAARFEAKGMPNVAAAYAASPFRDALRRKDPRGFAEFTERLGGHSTIGSVNTLRGVQRDRPTFRALADQLATIQVPTLVLAGDEDEPSLEASLYLRRTIPTAALAVLPRTGHAINLEEPDLFNASVADFIATVAAGRWEVGAAPTPGGHIL